MSYHPGQTVRLNASLTTAKYYVWTLWDGRVRTSLSPYLDVSLRQVDYGTLAFTCSGVGYDSDVGPFSAEIEVETTPMVTASTITGNGSRYGSSINVELTLTESPSLFRWELDGISVPGTETAVAVTVSKTSRLVYRYWDRYSIQYKIDFDLYGHDAATLPISQIDLSPVKGRAASGSVMDLRVTARSGCTGVWNLAGFSAQIVSDAVVTTGDYTQFHAQILLSSQPEGARQVSFTASLEQLSRVVTAMVTTTANTAPTHTGITAMAGGTELATGSTQYLGEDTVTYAVAGVSDLSEENGISDLVTAIWNFSADGAELAPLYGPSVDLDLSGLAGKTVSGTLTLEDSFGAIASVDLDDIVVSRSSSISIAGSALPASPSTAGVPVVITAGLASKLWSKLSRYESMAYAYAGYTTGVEVGDALVLPTTGRGGRSTTVAVTGTDYAGETGETTLTVTATDNAPSPALVWTNAPGNRAEAGSLVTFYACAIDVDGDTGLVYEWHFTNPIQVVTGATAVITTNASLIGSKITGTVNIYDAATAVTRNSSTTRSTVIPDVLVLSSMSGGESGTATGQYPDCPECSGSQVQLPTPTVEISGPGTVTIGVAQTAAFLFRYSGLSIASVNRTVSGPDYSCDSGWVSAPSPTQYQVYEDWGPGFVLSAACTPWYTSAKVGTYTLTYGVKLSDGTVYYSTPLSVSAGLATFTNTHRGTVTKSCPSGTCGPGASVEVIAGYTAATTNQTYADLGLDPAVSTVAQAQAAVNARALTFATTDAELLATSEPACYILTGASACGVMGDGLNASVLATFTGDALTAAQAAVTELEADNLAPYRVTLTGVNYIVAKTRVSTTIARVSVRSEIVLASGTYLTFVLDPRAAYSGTSTLITSALADTGSKLYLSLYAVYGADLATYVSTITSSTGKWADALLTGIRPDLVTPGRKQVVIVLNAEDSVYDTVLGGAGADAAALCAAVTSATDYDYYAGHVFYLPLTASPATTRWNELVSDTPTFASLAESGTGSQARIGISALDPELVLDADMLFTKVQAALAGLGIILADPV